jgi:hypothetical protein
VTLENNVRIKPGFTINFPTGPIVAEEILRGSNVWNNPGWYPDPSAIFEVDGQNVIAFPEWGPGNAYGPDFNTYISSDGGDTWTNEGPYPPANMVNVGVKNNSPSKIIRDGNKWQLFTYWDPNRASARYTFDTAWSSSYPDALSPTINTASNLYDPRAFDLDGGDNCVQVARQVYDPNSASNNFVGLQRKNIYTGVFLDLLPLQIASNGVGLTKMNDGSYFCLVQNATDIKVFYVDPTMTTFTTSTTPAIAATQMFLSNKNDTSLFVVSNGAVLQWKNPTSPTFTPVTLSGNYNVVTRLGRKSYMWLAASMTQNQTARLWYSTDADGSTFSASYVELTLPSTPASGAPWSYIKPGPDNWWYGCYRENGTNLEVIFRFQFETTSGNPPP